MDQRLHPLVDRHQFVDPGAALVAAVAAVVAADRMPQAVLALSAAVRAELAHQALRQHAQQRGRQQEGLDAHVGQAGHRAGRVVGVQRRQHQVAGQRGLHRDLRGLMVADLADHDHVRILAQDGAQRLGEGQVDLGIDLGLADAGQLVLDRVLDRQHIGGRGVDLAERGVERRRLARAGRAGDQHDAVRLGDALREARQRVALHAEAGQRELGLALVEQAQHRAFAMHAGQRRHPHVDRAPADAQRDAAVLRQALLGDVELGHDLQPADEGRVQRLVGLNHLAQRAVHAEAHGRGALVGLDVDVAGAVLGGLRQQRVEHADDRRVVGGFQQILHGGQVLHHAAQVDRALDLADDRRGAGLAAGIGLGDALGQTLGGLQLDRIDRMQAHDLGQRGARCLGIGPQHQALAVVLEQQALRLGPGIGQGMAHGRIPWRDRASGQGREPLDEAGGRGAAGAVGSGSVAAGRSGRAGSTGASLMLPSVADGVGWLVCWRARIAS